MEECFFLKLCNFSLQEIMTMTPEDRRWWIERIKKEKEKEKERT